MFITNKMEDRKKKLDEAIKALEVEVTLFEVEEQETKL